MTGPVLLCRRVQRGPWNDPHSPSFFTSFDYDLVFNSGTWNRNFTGDDHVLVPLSFSFIYFRCTKFLSPTVWVTSWGTGPSWSLFGPALLNFVRLDSGYRSFMFNDFTLSFTSRQTIPLMSPLRPLTPTRAVTGVIKETHCWSHS